jgi:hypothetical protein
MGLKKKRAQKKVTIIFKPPEMKLMQVWFANTMRMKPSPSKRGLVWSWGPGHSKP